MSIPSSGNTMRAVVLKGRHQVVVEDVPIPQVETPRDVVIKVHQAGLCGSDLHQYRGHAGSDIGFVMGHEAVGEVVEVGEGVENFKKGDLVVSTFHTSCGKCNYCTQGYTSRCDHAQCLGGPGINGAQAEYLRIPLGDSTLLPLPGSIPKELALLMADILPTGYSVAWNARQLASDGKEKGGVCVVIGCGPVGLCAITSALTLFHKVYATDLSPDRLLLAKKHGATALSLPELQAAMKDSTPGGLGADAVLEVVGHPSALTTAMELTRPYGVVSSCGVHTRDVTLNGEMLYDKNLRFQFGRCSVRTFFKPALKVLEDNMELFKGFIEHRVSLEEAPEYYKLFEQNRIAKTVFLME